MILELTDITAIPATEGVFINWLLGLVFGALIAIIGWLMIRVNQSLLIIKQSLDDVSKTIIKLETEMSHVKTDGTFLREQVTRNIHEIGVITTEVARVTEWKKLMEKNNNNGNN